MTRHALGFCVIGVLLFGGSRVLDGRLLEREPIVVARAEVERLRREWAGEMRREPAAAELEALVRRFADEETLHREALQLGLHERDPVARRRLIQNMRFVHGGAGTDAALFAEAHALDMHRHDPVVRRRLVQAMEERFAAGVSVDDADVRAYVAAHAGRYATPRRVAFAHVFAGADRHGDVAAAARRLGASLPAPGAAHTVGDPFLHGSRFAPASETDIARRLGSGFAAAVMQAPPHAWSGPLASVYGLHWVYVEHDVPAAAPDVAAVYRAARYALLEERGRQAVRERVVALRARYPLDVEWPGLTVAAAP